jgi:hypothetical protein
MGCTCSSKDNKNENDYVLETSERAETLKSPIENGANSKLSTKMDTASMDTDNKAVKRTTKYTITVETSEPQELDPTNVFYIKDPNPQPRGNKLIVNLGEQKILRAPTFDLLLTEKIQNGENIDEILNDPRFGGLVHR